MYSGSGINWLRRLVFSLGLCSFAVAAQVVDEIPGKDFDDWIAAEAADRSAVYALTMGANDTFFGKACVAGQSDCEYRLGVRGSCEFGSRHAALIHSDAGQIVIPMICLGSGPRSDRSIYVFEDLRRIELIVRRSTTLHVVLVSPAGGIQDLKFSMRGSSLATRWVDEAHARIERPQPGVRPARSVEDGKSRDDSSGLAEALASVEGGSVA